MADLSKLKRLDALIQDLLDEIEDAEGGDAMAEALFEPLSPVSYTHLTLPTKA